MFLFINHFIYTFNLSICYVLLVIFFLCNSTIFFLIFISAIHSRAVLTLVILVLLLLALLFAPFLLPYLYLFMKRSILYRGTTLKETRQIVVFNYYFAVYLLFLYFIYLILTLRSVMFIFIVPLFYYSLFSSFFIRSAELGRSCY